MSIKTGKAKFGGEFTRRKYWKLKDGDATFRIVPPLGFNGKEPDGRWSHFYNVHYGYNNSKGQMRVFQSPLVKNRKTKMVEVPDAALERIEILQAKQRDAKAKNDEVTSKKISDLLQKYNLDNNHYVNAIDEQGNIGILKLRHRAKLALDATIKALRDQGVEPLDAETGRFFTFRRSGNGLETTFQVTVKQRELNIDGVGKVKQDIVHVLTEDLLVRLEKEAAELDKLFKRPTAEEVSRIVNSSDLMTGVSSAVDEILDNKDDSNTGNNEGYDDDTGSNESSSASTTVTPVAQAVVTARSAPSTQTVTQTVVTATSTAPAQSLSSGSTKTTAQTVSEMSDEDFLKSLGL
jgi:hypothetical protein